MIKSLFCVLLGFILLSQAGLSIPCLCVEEEPAVHDSSIVTMTHAPFSIRMYIEGAFAINRDPWQLISISNPTVLQQQGTEALILKRPARLDWNSSDDDPNLYSLDQWNTWSYFNTAMWEAVGRQWNFQGMEAGDTILTFKNSQTQIQITVTLTPSNRGVPGSPIQSPENSLL